MYIEYKFVFLVVSSCICDKGTCFFSSILHVDLLSIGKANNQIIELKILERDYTSVL